MEARQTWNRKDFEPQLGFTLDAPPLQELDLRLETHRAMASSMVWLSMASIAAGFSIGVWLVG